MASGAKTAVGIGLTLAAGASMSVLASGPATLRVAQAASPAPGATLPIEKAHTYRMSGRIRPLLFWIGRDGVGMARIVWRRGDSGASAYELLIGTDPASAPRRLNRWGYIAEEHDGPNGSLLAMMSRSEESSLGEVRDRPPGSGEFLAMCARVEAGTSHSVVPVVFTQSDPTFRDVDALIDQVLRASDRATARRVPVPAGTRPGFLAAVAELVHASVEALRQSGGGLAPPRMLSYVYGVRLYDLTLRAHERVPAIDAAGLRRGQAARGRFEIRNRATGERTRFELVYGLDGPLAEVPIEIAYQPRWWLKVELRLER